MKYFILVAFVFLSSCLGPYKKPYTVTNIFPWAEKDGVVTEWSYWMEDSTGRDLRSIFTNMPYKIGDQIE